MDLVSIYHRTIRDSLTGGQITLSDPWLPIKHGLIAATLYEVAQTAGARTSNRPVSGR